MNLIFILDFSSILSWISAAVTRVITTLGYPGLGLMMFLENVIPSIPSEVVLPFAGSLIRQGEFTLIGITIVGMIGSVLGAWVYYGLGYWLDESRVRSLVINYGKYLFISEKDLDRALEWFNRSGELVIFFGRMIPLVRSLISIPAGFARISPVRFTVFTALGTALWSLLLAYTGKLLGDNWELIGDMLSRFKYVVIILLGAGLIWFLGRRIYRAYRESS